MQSIVADNLRKKPLTAWENIFWILYVVQIINTMILSNSIRLNINNI